MSFSMAVKEGLCRNETHKKCCEKAELAGFLRMSGSIHFDSNGMGITVTTFANVVARHYFKLLKETYHTEVQMSTEKSSKLQQRVAYLLKIPLSDSINDILIYLTGVNDGNLWYEPDMDNSITSECCKRSYLRGAFLGGGFINDPEGEYHLEMVCQDIPHAEFIMNLLEPFGINAKVTNRKKQYVIYLKEAEQISDFLNVIGAHQSLLEFENVRIMKDMRNNINRQMNCETANMDKTINTGLRQATAIKQIIDNNMLKHLPDNLQQMAMIRLENPEASLKELGQLLDPPIGKSGVNHRLRKIEEFAEENNLI